MEFVFAIALICVMTVWAYFTEGRRGDRRKLAARRALQLGPGYAPAAHQADTLMRGTALLALTGRGLVRGEVATKRSLPSHDLTVSAFELHAARVVPLRWTWLEVERPFRLMLPTTVLAMEVARTWPHVIVKRAGPGDVIARRPPDDHDRSLDETFGLGLGLVARGAARLKERTEVPTPPPATIGRAALAVDLPDGWRAWGPPAPDPLVLRLAVALAGDGAFAPEREIVIEVLGSTLLAYTASGLLLANARLEEFDAAVLAACERALAATPSLTARGVEPT